MKLFIYLPSFRYKFFSDHSRHLLLLLKNNLYPNFRVITIIMFKICDARLKNTKYLQWFFTNVIWEASVILPGSLFLNRYLYNQNKTHYWWDAECPLPEDSEINYKIFEPHLFFLLLALSFSFLSFSFRPEPAQSPHINLFKQTKLKHIHPL